MTISIETTSAAELEAIMTVFKNLNMDNVNVLYNNKPTLSITKGDKTDPAFNVWADNPRQTSVVEEEQPAYQKAKPAFDFASYCGILTPPNDVSEIDNQLKAMRDEWDRDF